MSEVPCFHEAKVHAKTGKPLIRYLKIDVYDAEDLGEAARLRAEFGKAARFITRARKKHDAALLGGGGGGGSVIGRGGNSGGRRVLVHCKAAAQEVSYIHLV